MRDRFERLARDVLKLNGRHRDAAAELFKGRRIIKGKVDDLIRNLEGRCFEAPRPEHGPHAHSPSCKGDHAAELTATDDAYDAMRRVKRM